MMPFTPWTEAQLVHGLQAYAEDNLDDRDLVVTVTYGNRGGPRSVVLEVNGRLPTVHFINGKIYIYRKGKMNFLEHDMSKRIPKKHFELAWQISHFANKCLEDAERKPDPSLGK